MLYDLHRHIIQHYGHGHIECLPEPLHLHLSQFHVHVPRNTHKQAIARTDHLGPA